MSTPLCVAARTALLIDPDKSVRPCCSYGNYGQHLPGTWGIDRLSPARRLADIVRSEPWQQVVEALDRGAIPTGCADCMRREVETGASLRRNLYSPNWQRGLTYLELNTSNKCTLQCRHCGPGFSHRWAKDLGGEIHAACGDELLPTLRELDLSHLERVMFKGGEPMVNGDVAVTLNYLREIGRLEHTHVSMVTNGSVIDDELVELMLDSHSVGLSISVDGVGDVQRYIRHGRSDTSLIERFVARWRDLQAARRVPTYVDVRPLVSVMVYNVHALPAIAEWWRRVQQQPGHLTMLPIQFDHFVLDPPELSVTVLRDPARARLAAHLQALDAGLYGNVVRLLQQPWAGAETHAAFVQRTRSHDALLGTRLEDLVPGLARELADGNA
jgi:hypothetical protein